MNKNLLVAATLSISAGLPAHSIAGGFQLFTQSANSLATAGADQGLGSEAAVAFWNPAGMMRLQGSELDFTLTISAIRQQFSLVDARAPWPPNAPTPITNDGSGPDNSPSYIPNFFYTKRINDDWAVGLSAVVPFGLPTSYSQDWAGRYYGLESTFQSFALNPVVAYRVSPSLSIGGGVSLVYATATLSNAIDFSTVCLAQASAFPPLGPVCDITGFNRPGTPATDGTATIKGDDWGFNWNVGAMWQPDPALRIGLTYRGKIDLSLKGSSTFAKPAGLPPPIAAAPVFTDGSQRTDITLPETAAASLAWDVNDRCTVYANATWTRWSRLADVYVQFDNGAPSALLQFQWNDSTRYSIGADYRVDDRWKIRGGVGYDQSPIPDQYRNPRLPGTDHTILAVGATYKMSEQLSFDAGYARAFFQDAPISLATATAGSLVGTYTTKSANFLSLNAAWRF